MSGPGPVRGPSGSGDDDAEALVEALAEQARRLAAEDDQGGPPPAAWYRLARARRERAGRVETNHRRSWAGPFRAGTAAALVGAVGCLVVVGIAAVRWRQTARGPATIASGATPSVTAAAPVTPIEPGLSFSVQGATVTQGEEIDVVGSSNGALRFSDGTDVGLDVGTRLAVTARDARGARLRLQSGRARFQVVHLPNAAWKVDAGPYLIEVTGTVFAVRWAEADQTMEIAMESGSVRVSGPLLAERMELRTGQRLRVRPTAGDVELERIDQGAALDSPRSDSTSESAPSSAPSSAPPARSDVARVVSDEATHREPLASRRPGRVTLALASPRSGFSSPARPSPGLDEGTGAAAATTEIKVEPPPFEAPAPPEGAGSDPDSPLASRDEGANEAGSKRAGWVSRRWAARVASGESQAVLADAEHIGFEATLAGADAADLTAFADAARYSGRPDLADRALLETRRRFPGSTRAQAAAFLLGRAADDRGDAAAGLAWFRRYLSDAPRGPFASEALGRQMIAVEKLRGPSAAAPLAAEYLRRFPNGTYLLRARALLLDR